MMLMTTTAVFLSGLCSVGSPDTMSLHGEWRFALDAEDEGIKQAWWQTPLEDAITLPATVQSSGKGKENTQPALARMTPKYEYTGPAWYQRDVEVPEQWKDKRILLFLERCQWESHLWVNDQPAGMINRLSTPHVYDLTDIISPGRHTLTLRVDNTRHIDLGFSMQIMDDAQTNWNGILGDIELQTTDLVWIDSLQVYPDITHHRAQVKLRIGNVSGKPAQGTVSLSAIHEGHTEAEGEIAFDTSIGITEIAGEILFTSSPPALWDEFDPQLYHLEAALHADPYHDRKTVRFGMRHFEAHGTRFHLNDRPIFLRGNVDCNIHPMTGYAPVDKAGWYRLLGILKDHGMNHVRFHSTCPPRACFEVADELGIILQIENPVWMGRPLSAIPERAAFLEAEMDAILETFGNHPSFCLYSMGNELGPEPEPFQMALVERGRQSDPRRLYTRNSGFINPDAPQDYHVASGTPEGMMRSQYLLRFEPPETSGDFRESLSAMQQPVISHEITMWCMFPDLSELERYDGLQQPRYIERYIEGLHRNNLLEQAEAFKQASGALMSLYIQEEIERQLRTPNHAGFQYLSLADYTGFGISLNGFLNAWHDSKGVFTPEKFRRFCGPIIPLLRMEKRTWLDTEPVRFALDITNYTPSTLTGRASWKITDAAESCVAEGKFDAQSFPGSEISHIGEILIAPGALTAPALYKVHVQVDLSNDTTVQNDWDFWVYPDIEVHEPAAILIAQDWDDDVRKALTEGRTVLFLPQHDKLFYAIDGQHPPLFAGIQQLRGQPGTLGILCDPAHPALAAFPTESHSNWQWWSPLTSSVALILDRLSHDLQPIVQVIDNTDRNHRLAALFEVKAGEGRLMVSGMDLTESLDTQPATRQLKRSILEYMTSSAFTPTVSVTIEELDKLFQPEPIWNDTQAPLDTTGAVLDVYPGAGVSHIPYPDGWLGWESGYDTVIACAEGFGYTVESATTRNQRLNISAWENRWRSYAMRINVRCPPGFTGTLYLQMLACEGKDHLPDIWVNNRKVTAPDINKADGAWVAINIDETLSEEGDLKLYIHPEEGYVWITRMIMTP